VQKDLIPGTRVSIDHHESAHPKKKDNFGAPNYHDATTVDSAQEYHDATKKEIADLEKRRELVQNSKTKYKVPGTWNIKATSTSFEDNVGGLALILTRLQLWIVILG